jgi:hypothetical protein
MLPLSPLKNARLLVKQAFKIGKTRIQTHRQTRGEDWVKMISKFVSVRRNQGLI